MMIEMGDAADYKSNPLYPGLSDVPAPRFWPSGQGLRAAIVDRL
ncbi:hypothetical protein [Burkholderia territorii]|nr:hypothetical protein [Burkholderia territorii]